MKWGIRYIQTTDWPGGTQTARGWEAWTYEYQGFSGPILSQLYNNGNIDKTISKAAAHTDINQAHQAMIRDLRDGETWYYVVEELP